MVACTLPLPSHSLLGPTRSQHPPWQIDGLLEVYCTKGAAYLETHRVPLLSWEQVQEHKARAEAAAALPAPPPATATPAAALLPVSFRRQQPGGVEEEEEGTESGGESESVASSEEIDPLAELD